MQSRVGPVEWLKPYTDETIKELGKMGVRQLLTVPIRSAGLHPKKSHSNTLQHIEMLEENR